MENIRKTKIICTIGPVTNTVDGIFKLIQAGMNIARINFSHGNHNQHALMVKNIREAAHKANRVVPIIGDLCGPKVRVRELKEPITLEKGELVHLYHTESSTTGFKALPISYEKLSNDVNKGDMILIDDGLLELKVVDITEEETICEVIEGGLVLSNKGVNFPNSFLSVPSLTAKDMKDVKFAIEHKLAFLALSFVRDSEDIVKLQALLADENYLIPVIAKIEKPQAIDDIDQIIIKSDAIMIARGDLGIEMNAYEVPILQKKIIRKCLDYNKPVITATQMLESMIQNPRCTRAEASDVANAVFDGTDAVMLSGETSIGSHPTQTVAIMQSILLRAEQTDYFRFNLFNESTDIENSLTAIDLSKAACLIADDINASLIIAMTKTGRTARFLAKYRTKTPIVAFTPYPSTIPMLILTWGVTHVLIDSFGDSDMVMGKAKKYVLDKGWITTGNTIVFVAGSPMLETNEINLIKIDKA